MFGFQQVVFFVFFFVCFFLSLTENLSNAERTVLTISAAISTIHQKTLLTNAQKKTKQMRSLDTDGIQSSEHEPIHSSLLMVSATKNETEINEYMPKIWFLVIWSGRFWYSNARLGRKNNKMLWVVFQKYHEYHECHKATFGNVRNSRIFVGAEMVVDEWSEKAYFFATLRLNLNVLWPDQ